MKEFNLSDKEIRQLLQSEGLEEPSMRFERNILEAIDRDTPYRPIKVPRFVGYLFIALVTIPFIIVLAGGGFEITSLNAYMKDWFSIEVNLSAGYYYLTFATISTVWLAFAFNYTILDQRNTKVKKG